MYRTERSNTHPFRMNFNSLWPSLPMWFQTLWQKQSWQVGVTSSRLRLDIYERIWTKLPLNAQTQITKVTLGPYTIQGVPCQSVEKYTANAYRQTTDKLMFKSVISTVRWIRK